METLEPVLAPRLKAEKELQNFISQKGRSGLVYFRGRRRVGKTTLLKGLGSTNPNVFYFTGIADESNRSSLTRFAKSWDRYAKHPALSRLKPSELDWSQCFEQVANFATKNPNTIITIVLDEIQWIAKRRSGVVGTLKDHWIDWERTNNLKVIICGSSNKFFVEQTGGEEKILRGLKTHSDIVLAPLTAAEVKEYYFSGWSTDEVLALYMMTGGIPYYLNQLPQQAGFIKAANEAFFTKRTIFLSEVDEVLNVEFNRAGITTVKKIFSGLGITGATFAQLANKLSISRAGLFEALTKLVEFGLLQQRQLLPLHNRTRSEAHYFITDPYLLFYFACLEPMRTKIEDNEKQLLITNLINSERALYIANFSGRAFEIFIRNLLASPASEQQRKLLELIRIPDRDYQIYDSLPKEDYGDFILVHRGLRTRYVIECKWTQYVDLVKEGIEQTLEFTSPGSTERIERIVLTNCKVSAAFKTKAATRSVKVISTADLFENCLT